MLRFLAVHAPRIHWPRPAAALSIRCVLLRRDRRLFQKQQAKHATSFTLEDLHISKCFFGDTAMLDVSLSRRFIVQPGVGGHLHATGKKLLAHEEPSSCVSDLTKLSLGIVS